LTSKHLTLIHGNIEETKSSIKEQTFTCKKCQKSYATRGGFWKHTKKCLPQEVAKVSQEEVSLQSIFNFLQKHS
jgi:phosphoribosylaminoimidazole (AIR) synthetase